MLQNTGPYSLVGSNADCTSSGSQFDSGLVLYFDGDWSWNNLYGHSPPSTDSRRDVVSYKRKYVLKVPVIRLIKLVHEKVWLDELTLDMSTAVDRDINNKNLQTKVLQNFIKVCTVRWEQIHL